MSRISTAEEEPGVNRYKDDNGNSWWEVAPGKFVSANSAQEAEDAHRHWPKLFRTADELPHLVEVEVTTPRLRDFVEDDGSTLFEFIPGRVAYGQSREEINRSFAHFLARGNKAEDWGFVIGSFDPPLTEVIQETAPSLRDFKTENGELLFEFIPGRVAFAPSRERVERYVLGYPKPENYGFAIDSFNPPLIEVTQKQEAPSFVGPLRDFVDGAGRTWWEFQPGRVAYASERQVMDVQIKEFLRTGGDPMKYGNAITDFNPPLKEVQPVLRDFRINGDMWYEVAPGHLVYDQDGRGDAEQNWASHNKSKDFFGKPLSSFPVDRVVEVQPRLRDFREPAVGLLWYEVSTGHLVSAGSRADAVALWAKHGRSRHFGQALSGFKPGALHEVLLSEDTHVRHFVDRTGDHWWLLAEDLVAEGPDLESAQENFENAGEQADQSEGVWELADAMAEYAPFVEIMSEGERGGHCMTPKDVHPEHKRGRTPQEQVEKKSGLDALREAHAKMIADGEAKTFPQDFTQIPEEEQLAAMRVLIAEANDIVLKEITATEEESVMPDTMPTFVQTCTDNDGDAWWETAQDKWIMARRFPMAWRDYQSDPSEARTLESLKDTFGIGEEPHWVEVEQDVEGVASAFDTRNYCSCVQSDDHEKERAKGVRVVNDGRTYICCVTCGKMR
jgi:hypothetical protein